MITQVSNTTRKSKALTWVYYLLHALLVLDIFMAGVAFLITSFASLDQISNTFARLGYPAYLLPFAGIVKIAAALALLSRSILREWAHVGLFFLLLLAFYSHLAAGDSFTMSLPPLLVFLMNIGSYILRKRVNTE
jgi:uncharacterized membrane protein YphA (DoxX/SURF4 family)